ncbi:hypothetical protein ACTJJ8_23735 [Agrobacterium radiobacter]|jgi:Flp pilus assembly protein TadB|uniref:hypothetical protein n=1 Tax=Agrobacterium tumefaciens complex TaxID=1183400 RepID=UPI001659025D|nr:hypothetical protein [Agrobacterium tumefaciens]QNP80973.1 hypothetical protein IAI05_06970 [Agrobacterium tumefaciens]
MTPTTDDSDLRTRVVSVEHGITAMQARLDAIEKWQRQVEIADARADERWKHVDNRFNDLDKKIEKISGILSKLMWILLTGIGVGFVGFIVNGGLKVP